MGQDQDPYDDAGGFTPYQPDATPDSEPSEAGADAPYVPYGGAPEVPYGAAAAPLSPPSPATGSGKRALPWVIGIGVVVLLCGGGAVAGIVALVAGSESSDSGEVYVNDLEYGQCLRGGGFATDEPVSGLKIVECDEPHDAQVLAIKTLSEQEAADYEFDDTAQIDVNCRDRFSQRDKHLLMREDLTLIAFTETEDPVGGDQVACLLARADGKPLEGDFRDEMADAPTAPEPS